MSMEALANLIMWPIRFIIKLIKTFIFLTLLAICFIIAPFLSYFTIADYQHQANDALVTSNYRKYMLMDFSNNSAMALDSTLALDTDYSGKPYHTEVPKDYNYKSANVQWLGSVPPDWGFWNFVGFYTDYEEWERGKSAPMYAAYAEAASTTDALREELSLDQERRAPIRLPDAPKIVMAWRTEIFPRFTLFGVAPEGAVSIATDLRFREDRDLFVPSLTDGQAKAIAQMQYTMTDEYWIREAHANGIFNCDNQLREKAENNRAELMATFTSDQSVAHWEVLIEVGYLLFILLLILGIGFKIYYVITHYTGDYYTEDKEEY
jgi:hypothetical protein